MGPASYPENAIRSASIRLSPASTDRSRIAVNRDNLQALLAPASPSIEDLALLAERLSLPVELRYP